MGSTFENKQEFLKDIESGKYKDCMVDLESMGVGNSPALTQISAVTFDINTGEIGNKFNYIIDLKSSMDAGLTISAGTIKFWMTNPSVTHEAREIVMSATSDHNEDSVKTLERALTHFNAFININNVKYVHGNGVASDNVWLRSAFEAVNIKPNFTFRDDFCFRTIRTLAKRVGWEDNVKREGIYHDGLDDAKHQVKVLRSCLEHLNINNIDKEKHNG